MLIFSVFQLGQFSMVIQLEYELKLEFAATQLITSDYNHARVYYYFKPFGA